MAASVFDGEHAVERIAQQHFDAAHVHQLFRAGGQIGNSSYGNKFRQLRFTFASRKPRPSGFAPSLAIGACSHAPAQAICRQGGIIPPWRRTFG